MILSGIQHSKRLLLLFLDNIVLSDPKWCLLLLKTSHTTPNLTPKNTKPRKHWIYGAF